SLLSIKAVDKLDPQRRRSNVNKDLRAIGLATVASGLLGGVNVVSVIARSSVNVNNGATNRLANLFHGTFLAIFVVLFTVFLQHIPLPALAAILVYTGYKLAAPSVFRNMASVGLVQFIIFLVTLLATLFTGLISGIAIGIVVTLLFQLSAISNFSVLLRNIFRPNTLLYQESNNQYHLSVRAFSNFLNFLGIKKKLDSVPRDSTVIVDFSLSQFVDHSVMDQLQDYNQNFKVAGGNLEIIGLDDLRTSSSHPLAPRQTRMVSKRKTNQITRRQKSISMYADRLNWKVNIDEFYESDDFEGFKYFDTRIIDKGRNRLEGEQGNVKILMADLDYHEGEFIARESLHSTMVCLHLPVRIAEFVLDKENLLDKVAHLAGFSDINFKGHSDFSHRFRLKGDHAWQIRRFFDDSLINFFESNKAYHVESNGRSLLIFEKERISTIGEIKQLVSFASRLAGLLDIKYSD
ncbi:MAG: SulP family inorganic anion transporter, partial [Owenweeksia sp.]